MTRAAVALLAFFSVAVCVAQEPASGDPGVGARLAGTWSGQWQSSRNSSAYGSMDIEMDVKGEQVIGRAKAGIRGDCSNQWQKLTGVIKEGKVLGYYDLGGRCGKVDLILTVEPDGTTMTGTWKSEFPSNGTYSLRKVSAAGR